MKIAIDIDGTITRLPKFFKQFIDSFIDNDNEIHILTGAKPNSRNDGNNKEGNYSNLPNRMKQLKKYGIENYTVLISVLRETDTPGVAEGKGDYCKENKIDIIFEDNSKYAEAIKRISPHTIIFLIR